MLNLDLALLRTGQVMQNTTNIDMAGIILVPYDDKQYSVGMQYTYANNLIDTAEITL